MINLIVRGKELVQGMADAAKTCYVRWRHPPRSVRREVLASPIGTHSLWEREYGRLSTTGAMSSFAVATTGLAGQPKVRIINDESERATARAGWRVHGSASVARRHREGRGSREVLDKRMHLKEMLELLPIAMLTVDQQHRIVFANARAIALFGYSGEALIGASIDMLFPIPACQAGGATDEPRVVEHGLPAETTTSLRVARRRDGEGFRVEIDTTHYIECDQNLQIIAVTGCDACREVDRHHNEMVHLARVSSLGELASSLAHELNQPLTAILSNAQAAQKFIESERANIAELREALDDIILDNCRASEVIQKIRTMVRKGEMELQPLDVGGLVRDIAELVHGDAVARQVHATFDVSGHPARVFGDKVQLQQVLLNLLLNAFDAVKECVPEERVIETTVREECGGGVRITVKDRGQGLTIDKMNNIFRPFFSTKPQGLGLGLSISRTIVTAHGGQLWAENNACKGASFHITLPQAPDIRQAPCRAW